MSDCKLFRPLIPGYLDGELSEDQASPLRKHLMDCRSCRTATQGEKALKGWFVAAEAINVPQGLAAHAAGARRGGCGAAAAACCPAYFTHHPPDVVRAPGGRGGGVRTPRLAPNATRIYK